MELLLWRHAKAEDGLPDHARELTRTGREQARRVAAWLEEHGPREMRLLVSPATRTRQTASCFREAMELNDALASAAAPKDILAMIDWPNAQTPCLLVGHQPMLGEIAAALLPAASLPAFHKGALWWISGAAEEPARLRQIVEGARTARN
ncbi:MAG: histidine phosphatase family protein [Zoogloeaceae bacterium]|jgi:phosphohistidine phosphatase|nr:histidine phosphatase family protein [Zoogloeaceae bacterium]